MLRLRLGNETEAQRYLRAGDARQSLGLVCETSEFPIVEQGDLPPRGDQHRALVILIDRVAAERPPALVEQPVCVVVHHERRLGQGEIPGLRAALVKRTS